MTEVFSSRLTHGVMLVGTTAVRIVAAFALFALAFHVMSTLPDQWCGSVPTEYWVTLGVASGLSLLTGLVLCLRFDKRRPTRKSILFSLLATGIIVLLSWIPSYFYALGYALICEPPY